jgi:hypothetical protein
MTAHWTIDSARRVFPARPAATVMPADVTRADRPRRFGDELEGPFSPNLMRDQFDRLFRQFGR